MKVIFEAFDGTQFDDEEECIDYENKFEHSSVFDIAFFNKEGNEYYISDLYDESAYNNAERVIVHDEKELKDLAWITKENGWCEFEQIDDVGEWVRFESDGTYEGTWMRVISTDAEEKNGESNP